LDGLVARPGSAPPAASRSASTATGLLTTLGRLVDDGVILPRAPALYDHAASELHEPRLRDMLRDGRPVYAWPYDAGHVWTTVKASWAIRILKYLTRYTEVDQRREARSAGV
jgi:hypothetical protein